MKIKARLSIEEGTTGSAKTAASELSKAGFNVTSVSTHGVSFEGEKSQFQVYFGQKLQKTGPNMAFQTQPKMPESLAKSVASVYFPTKPEFFP